MQKTILLIISFILAIVGIVFLVRGNINEMYVTVLLFIISVGIFNIMKNKK